MRPLHDLSVRIFAPVCLLLALAVAECRAAELTLANLGFLVPPKRKVEFEAAYRERVLPLLKKRGFVESSRQRLRQRP